MSLAQEYSPKFTNISPEDLEEINRAPVPPAAYRPSLEDFSPEALERANITHASFASKNLHISRVRVGRRVGRYLEYTPPDPGHYLELYYWDEVFATIIDAEYGTEASLGAAERGIKSLFKGQYESGFIPNIQDMKISRLTELKPEQMLGFDSKDHSNYTQPPIVALGISKIYKARKNQEGVSKELRDHQAKEFLSSVYEPMKRAYEFLDLNRRVAPDDRRVFIIHPHETGRDSDPTYRGLKRVMIPRKGEHTPKIIDRTNTFLDYGQILLFGNKLKRANGDMAKIRELFGAVDLMFNCMLADNLHVAAELALELAGTGDDEASRQYRQDASWFRQYAIDVEGKLQDKNWFPKARNGKGGFYSTDKDGRPYNEVGINNLAPLMLPNLSEEQIRSLSHMLDNDFDVPYPLPSVGKFSKNFDPHNQQLDRLWEGSTWINLNWYYSERGIKRLIDNRAVQQDRLLKFRLQSWAIRLARKSKELYAMNGAKEFYDSITGRAQRTYRVKNFAWSNLALIMTGVRLEYEDNELESLVDEYAEFLESLRAEAEIVYT